MSRITFRVDFASSFKRGVNCPVPPLVSIEVDPSKLKPEDRELLAGRLNDKGEVCSRGEDEGWFFSGNTRYNTPQDDHAPLVTAAENSLTGVLDAIRAEETSIASFADRKSAKKAEKTAYERDLRLNQTIKRDTQTENVWLMNDGRIVATHWDPSGKIARAVATYERNYIVYYGGEGLTPTEDAEYKAKHDKLEAETKARMQAAADEVGKKLLAEVWQPRMDWIEAHGSPRLKRLVAEGIPSTATYDKERGIYDQKQFDAALTAERPGWRQLTSDEELDTDIADVTTRALALLDAARKLVPSSKLAKLKPSGKYVAYETFLDMMIVWPQD